MAKRPVGSTLIEWACGSSCRSGFTLLPTCWWKSVAGETLPSSWILNTATLPPL